MSDYIWIITIITISTFIGSIVIIPLVIINLSPEYFRERHHSMYQYKHPLIRYFVLFLKNILGYILLILGFIMLFIPGQGLLSITLGLFLINFPGKKKLERKFFSYPKINHVINTIRRKAGKEPIHFTENNTNP